MKKLGFHGSWVSRKKKANEFFFYFGFQCSMKNKMKKIIIFFSHVGSLAKDLGGIWQKGGHL